MTYKFLPVAILLSGALFAAQDASADGNAEDGAVLGYSCLGCHGIEGYRNAYPSYRVPRLGGQKPAYLKAALTAYRDGTRKHPTMNAQAASMTDEDIDNVVAWLATYGEAADNVAAEDVAHIEAATACLACHAEAGANVMPAPPVLSGQHAEYIKQALKQYQDNVRIGSVMNAFAAALTEDDIKAIAEFYSNQDGLTTTLVEE